MKQYNTCGTGSASRHTGGHSLMDRSGAIAFLTQIYRSLAGQSDLSPNNPAVNQGLGTLVATLQRWQAADFGSDLAEEPRLAEIAQQLPRLCGAAECEMEKWW